MYAVIEDRGNQLKVAQGDEITIDLMDLAPESKTIEFDRVLLIGGDKPRVGTPLVSGAKVKAEILGPERGEKLRVVKFRRRKNYRRKNGHRQEYLRVRISEITA